MEMDDPHGYGRIIRDRSGRVRKIVEEKDTTARQRVVQEVNTGLLAASTTRLKQWLSRIGNDNAQGEYYLTDIVAAAARDGVEIATASTENQYEVLGVNNKAQLARPQSAHSGRCDLRARWESRYSP